MKTINLNPDKPSGIDRKYFEEVYKEYFDRLFAYALVITKSEMMAQDVVSDVFFNLFNAQINLRSIKELKSYLFTSTKNQAVRALNNNPLNFQSDDYDLLAASIDKVNPEELLVGKELDDFLQQVIQQLPPMCALVFSLVREQGMKYQDVADELNISLDTVKYHVKTALKKIKSELDSRYYDGREIDWYGASQMMLVLAGFSPMIREMLF